jgi:hypothetical protein
MTPTRRNLFKGLLLGALSGGVMSARQLLGLAAPDCGSRMAIIDDPWPGDWEDDDLWECDYERPARSITVGTTNQLQTQLLTLPQYPLQDFERILAKEIAGVSANMAKVQADAFWSVT